jgi:hypothetical protein
LRSAPPAQAPWTIDVEGQAHSEEGTGYFDTIPRSVSPLSFGSIPEDDEPEESPQSSFLLPPLFKHGPVKEAEGSKLHLDTSDSTLVEEPRQRTPTPIGFRDVEDVDSPHPTSRPWRPCWWPKFLPDPYSLYITIFPTLRGFRSKSLVQKFIAIVALPAVFLLTITLPVVDSEAEIADDEIKSLVREQSEEPVIVVNGLSPDIQEEVRRLSTAASEISPRVWNRWLTGVQSICAPLYITFLLFRLFPFCQR